LWVARMQKSLSDLIWLHEIKHLVLNKRKTHKEISDILKERNPGIKGFSVMSVRRFCVRYGIRTKITKNFQICHDTNDVDERIKNGISDECLTKV